MTELERQKIVGLNIATRREELGISQASLASAVGLSQTYLSRIEAGNANPSLKYVYRIADALGIYSYQIINF